MDWTSLFNISNYIVISDHPLDDNDEPNSATVLHQVKPALDLAQHEENNVSDFFGIFILFIVYTSTLAFVALTVRQVRRSRESRRTAATLRSADAATVDKRLGQTTHLNESSERTGASVCTVCDDDDDDDEKLQYDHDIGHELLRSNLCSDTSYRCPAAASRSNSCPVGHGGGSPNCHKQKLTLDQIVTMQQTVDVIDVVDDVDDVNGCGHCTWPATRNRTENDGAEASRSHTSHLRAPTLVRKRTTPSGKRHEQSPASSSSDECSGRTGTKNNGNVCGTCQRHVRPSSSDSRETLSFIATGGSQYEADRFATSGTTTNKEDSIRRRSPVGHRRKVRSRSTSEVGLTSADHRPTGHRSRALSEPSLMPVMRSVSAPPASSPFSPLNSYLFVKTPSTSIGGRQEFSAATVLFGAVKTWLGGGLLSANPFPWSLNFVSRTSRSITDEENVLLLPPPDSPSRSVMEQSEQDSAKQELAAARDELNSALARIDEMTTTVVQMTEELQLTKRCTDDRALEWRSRLEESEKTGQQADAELKRARCRIEQLEDELSRHVATLAEAERDARKVADASSSEMRGLQAANQTLSVELEATRSRIGELVKRLTEASESHEALTKRMSEQQTQIALQRSHMKKQLADQRKSELEQKMLESQRNDSTMREQLARHETEIERRHSRINQLEGELDRTSDELNRVKSELGKVSDDLCAAQNELERVKSQLIESKSVRQTVEQNASLAEEEWRKVSVELGRVKDELERAVVERRRLESALHREDVRRCSVESELSTTAYNLGRVVDELGQVRRKLSQVQVEYDNSMSRLEQSENEKRTAVLDASKAKQELEETKAELHQLKENLCISRVDQKQKFNEMNARTLQIAEELSSLRCYSDLLQAKLNGSAAEQRERLAVMRQRVIDYDKRRAASAAGPTESHSTAELCPTHHVTPSLSPQPNTAGKSTTPRTAPVVTQGHLLEQVDNMRSRCLREISDTETRQSEFERCWTNHLLSMQPKD